MTMSNPVDHMDRVYISAEEYAKLIEAKTLLDIVRDIVEEEENSYGDFDMLRVVLGYCPLGKLKKEAK